MIDASQTSAPSFFLSSFFFCSCISLGLSSWKKNSMRWQHFILILTACAARGFVKVPTLLLGSKAIWSWLQFEVHKDTCKVCHDERNDGCKVFCSQLVRILQWRLPFFFDENELFQEDYSKLSKVSDVNQTFLIKRKVATTEKWFEHVELSDIYCWLGMVAPVGWLIDYHVQTMRQLAQCVRTDNGSSG